MRRPNQILSLSWRPSIDIGAGIAASTTVWAWLVAAAHALKIERCVLNVGTTITASATDFWTFEFKAGSTVIAAWSTQDSAQGTLTANTPVEMILATSDADLSAFENTTVTLVVTKTGTPSALPAFNVCPEGSLY